MKRKRRVNQLENIEGQVVKLSPETCPEFEKAEKLFYAEQKSKNRRARTIAWHRENIRAFHTFARLYIMNGGDPFSLKKILGHNCWEMVHRATWTCLVPKLHLNIKRQVPLNIWTTNFNTV